MQDRSLKGVGNKNEEVGDTNEGLRDGLLRRYPGNRKDVQKGILNDQWSIIVSNTSALLCGKLNVGID